ncbi:unnamed protein product [Peronospora belbahrii]|nr:unnamed protein product [Peronospora belbahrii]
MQPLFEPRRGAVPVFVTGEVASIETQYRDGSFQFTTSCMIRLDETDSFILDLDKQLAMNPALFTGEKHIPVSPLSPSAAMGIPVKEGWESCFGSAFPSFSSFANHDNIMATLKITHMQPFACLVSVENHWTLRVSWLCVAEEIVFSIYLSKETSIGNKYEVAFCRDFGDEMVFHQLVECIRTRCSEVDAEPLCFAEPTLEPWLDASQELKGRRYAICDYEAAQLIEEMNSKLDINTLYEVAKMVKNHCRHHGNRRLFLEADRARFV